MKDLSTIFTVINIKPNSLMAKLAGVQKGTVIKLTNEGLDKLPLNEPDFAYRNVFSGWNQILDELSSLLN